LSGAIKPKDSSSKNIRSCITPKCASRPERGPTCAHRARKEGPPGLVGRAGAPKSCPEANLRAFGGRWLLPPPNRGPCSKPWQAGRQAQEGARKLAALSQPSPRTIQQHSAPGRPLLNLPLRLRCWHPSKSKIMMITTAQRGERGDSCGEGEVEAGPAKAHRQGWVLSPPSSRTQRVLRQAAHCSAAARKPKVYRIGSYR